MSYTFLLEQGEVSSVASYSDIPVSVLLSGTPTRGASCSLANVTGCYRASLSGMMSRRLTASPGAGVLTSLLAVSRVRTYPQRARAQGLTASGQECGDTWPASLARYDRATSSWRTAQSLLLGGLESYSETWPRWGTMRSGVCWELPTPGRHTDASESGLWPTPRCQMTRPVQVRMDQEKGHKRNLEEVVACRMMWPTPVADGDRRKNYAQGGTSLGFAIRMWPTPTAQDAKNNGAQSQMGRNTKPLNAEVGGALNPTWVEWLMGWPLGWTDCAVSAMDKFRLWQRLHGKR